MIVNGYIVTVPWGQLHLGSFTAVVFDETELDAKIACIEEMASYHAFHTVQECDCFLCDRLMDESEIRQINISSYIPLSNTVH